MPFELWTIGSKESDGYIIIVPHSVNNKGEEVWWVENGAYEVITDKENNKIYIPYTREWHESHYLGDIKGYGDYNETINHYRDTKEIIGINTISHKESMRKVHKAVYNDEVPF